MKLTRIFHTSKRRVRARGLQERLRALVGRVPSRGGLLLSHTRSSFLYCLLPLFLGSALACFGQRNSDSRPVPLDPVQAEQEGRALVAKLVAQRPEQDGTNTGLVRISDASGKEKKIPVRFEVTSTSTNWVSVYETLPSASGPGGTRLKVIHFGDQPNRYELFDSAKAGATNLGQRSLASDQLMAPFAGSDFWIADLGLEFLHWPKQRVLWKGDMRHGKSCSLLESTNPAPIPGGYARVRAWIMIESPHGLMHADAYDAQGKVVKRFDPTNVEKIQGEYQLEEMEIRNPITDSHTRIKFNLAETATGKPSRPGLGKSAQP